MPPAPPLADAPDAPPADASTTPPADPPQGPPADETPLRDRLSTWVQTTAIVLAGLWAVWTFVFQEIVLPRGDPAFISADTEMSVVGVRDTMLAVQLKFTVTNQGERSIYTLPGVATVWGSRLNPNELATTTLLDSVNTTMHTDNYESRVHLRHGHLSEPVLVGFLTLFGGNEFFPNSTAANELMIYVPRGKYDQLDVDLALPIVSDDDGIDARWEYHEDGADIELLRTGGERTTTLSDTIPAHERYADSKGFAIVESYTTLSLWPLAP